MDNFKEANARINQLLNINSTKKNTMKRTKIKVNQIPTYYRFFKATVKGHKGYCYCLSEVPSLDIKNSINNQFNNVIWMEGTKVYAPELKTSILFVSGKVIN